MTKTMTNKELQIVEIVDVKYRALMYGDSTRWLNNMKVLEICQPYTITNCRGTFTSTPVKFEQQGKKPKNFTIDLEDIYYIRKH